MILEGAARDRIELNSNVERELIPKRLFAAALRGQTLRRRASEGDGAKNEVEEGSRFDRKNAPRGLSAGSNRAQLESRAQFDPQKPPRGRASGTNVERVDERRRPAYEEKRRSEASKNRRIEELKN